VNGARDRYVDGPQVRRIIDHAENILGQVSRDVPPLTHDAQQLLSHLNHIASGVGDPQIADLQATLHDVRALTQRANGMANDAQAIVTHIRQGHGTVGALLMDEEMYDDLQELVRDLKHNPWKFFWRE
jgi:phospholipid/cholesterol/gamma-HCH transport system substrate-binding protein